MNRSRVARGPKHSVVVTARDLELLALIGACRYVSVPQVQRDLFGSADRARHRLRQLYNAGLLNVTLVNSTKPNLVSLSRQGLAVLTDHLPELGQRMRLPGPLRFAGIEHHLAIVDARLYSADLGKLRGTPLTRWSNSAGDLVRELGLTDLHLAPDGIAEFAVREGEFVRIGLELDRSTEGLGVIRKKLSAYTAAANRGLLDALWLIATGGPVRRAALARLAADHGLGDWMRVIPHEHVVARPTRELPSRNESG